MATYASYTAQQQAIVQNTCNLVRGGCSELARIFNHTKAIADDTNAVSLVAGLDSTEIIPNTSGLAGADDLTQAQLVALYTLLNGIRTTYDTSGNRAAMSRGCGINSMLG